MSWITLMGDTHDLLLVLYMIDPKFCKLKVVYFFIKSLSLILVFPNWENLNYYELRPYLDQQK